MQTPVAAPSPVRIPIPDAISEGRVIAIARNQDPAGLPQIAEAVREGGIRVLEVTLGSRDAFGAIEALASRTDGLLVGAGTVLSIDQAERALGAGARFLVMPHLDQELVAWAAGRGVPAFPGAFTPTEILAAWRAGACAVKLFPASAVGPAFVRELRGPLPEIPLVPTGGVTIETAPAFLAAGAIAVGMGGWLMAGGDVAQIRERAAAVVRALSVAT
jgi:2-dehydro-3-deoxyphosphogluconate aldolase / (4S)-4-hydroxy-2-oxoglutarate aldolase